jgi:hypothetical protein
VRSRVHKPTLSCAAPCLDSFQELPVRPSGNPHALTTPTSSSPINTTTQQLTQQAKIDQPSSPMPPLQVSVFMPHNYVDLGGMRDVRRLARLQQPAATSEHAVFWLPGLDFWRCCLKYHHPNTGTPLHAGGQPLAAVCSGLVHSVQAAIYKPR